MTTALFHEAMRHPSPGYALGERLNALYPDRYVLETESVLMVSELEAAGLCTCEPRRDVYQQVQTDVLDEGNAHFPNNTWETVTWDRTAFEVISLRWHGDKAGAVSCRNCKPRCRNHAYDGIVSPLVVGVSSPRHVEVHVRCAIRAGICTALAS